MPLTVCLTHDVDRVYKTYQYVTKDLRQGRVRNLRTLLHRKSPYWRFEELMELEDRFKARSTFFFLKETIPFTITRPREWKLSLGRYTYRDPAIVQVIRTLDSNGWEIGVHGSYNSYLRAELLREEKDALEQVVGHQVKGIRQHYLNLRVPDTWMLQRSAGFEYDASLGLKGQVGFPDNRYFPYVDSQTDMLIIPLTLMEGYLFKSARGRFNDALASMLALIDEADRRSAVLTALWHPHMYNDSEFPGYGRMYELLIEECNARGARFVTCAELLAEYGAGRGVARANHSTVGK